MARRRYIEDALHINVVRFLRVALPPEAVLWHTPNGGLRSKREAAKLKAFGTLAGMPDLFILYAGTLHGIELKAPKGVVQASQKDAAYLLFRAGCTTHVCRSVEEVETALKLNGVPLRARSMGLAIIKEPVVIHPIDSEAA